MREGKGRPSTRKSHFQPDQPAGGAAKRGKRGGGKGKAGREGGGRIRVRDRRRPSVRKSHRQPDQVAGGGWRERGDGLGYTSTRDSRALDRSGKGRGRLRHCKAGIVVVVIMTAIINTTTTLTSSSCRRRRRHTVNANLITVAVINIHIVTPPTIKLQAI